MSNAFDVTVEALRAQGLNADQILEELSCLFRKMEGYIDKPSSKEEIEAKIKSMLNKICMPMHIKGYNYWIQAIQVYTEGKLIIKKVYPQVAKVYGEKPANVERAMRYAVEVAFKRCPEETIKSVFGRSPMYMKKGKITNVEVLRVLSEYV